MKPAIYAALTGALVAALPSISRAQEDVQKALSNPISSLTIVPFQTNFDFRIGPARDGIRITTNIQPVLPFRLNEDWSLVVRTIVPVVGQTNIFSDAGSQFGLGDISQSFFFVPRTVDGFTWGVGPALQYRTGTDPLLTSGKWAAGPTLVALQQNGPWTAGILTNHVWSFAGDDERNDLSNTFLQPFLAYAASGGWTFTLNSQSTYDWVNKQWSIPVLGQVSKLTKMGDQPISIAGGVKYWVQSPEGGPHGLAAVVSVSFIFK